MKRRDFIKSAGAGGAVAATTLAAPAIAKERIEMVMVTTWPRDFPGLGTGAQRLAKNLELMSGGRIHVEYFAAGERVNDRRDTEGDDRRVHVDIGDMLQNDRAEEQTEAVAERPRDDEQQTCDPFHNTSDMPVEDLVRREQLARKVAR